MRRLFRLFVFCLVSAGCFGGSIVYLRVHKNVIAERVKGGSVTRADQTRGSKLDTSTENAAQGARGDPVRTKAGKLSPPPE